MLNLFFDFLELSSNRHDLSKPVAKSASFVEGETCVYSGGTESHSSRRGPDDQTHRRANKKEYKANNSSYSSTCLYYVNRKFVSPIHLILIFGKVFY